MTKVEANICGVTFLFVKKTRNIIEKKYVNRVFTGQGGPFLLPNTWEVGGNISSLRPASPT